MARTDGYTAAAQKDPATERRAYWSGEITKGKKRWDFFWVEGQRVVDEYRQQAADGNAKASKDKYNILYSSTETIRPNLYAQLPTVRAVLRNKDTASDQARDGAILLQNCAQYIIEEGDFDSVLENVVEDLLLPGMGAGWVRYEPTISYDYEEDGKTPLPDQVDAQGTHVGQLVDEQICLEYVYWKDFITGQGRVWKNVPWVAKCCWMTKDAATARFGKDKANTLTYSTKERDGKEADINSDTAEVWEIWDKRTKTVFWYSDGYAADVLDMQDDPLGLKNFFPCPRPLRAISTNGRITPRALYSQYKDQAEQINNLTKRIRLLTDALKVAGVYNGAVEKLSDLINPLSGNKMIPVENWAGFKGDGGIIGSIEWLPLADVVNALNQLLIARETCKSEIYEITGFSDILRGVSKASETLGAQNIKANWGGARLKKMQKDVQRFARDMIAMAAEIVAEHCTAETIGVFGGITPPDDPQAAQPFMVRFKAAIEFIKKDKQRTAAIDVETDSTILADETAERDDRMKFLAAAGAFLQQAVPAMEATPELGGLLGAMLMFTVRTFPTSRVIEDAFEAAQKAMANRPPSPPGGQEGQQKMQAAQIQAQTDQQKAQTEAQTKQAEIQARAQYEQARVQSDNAAEQNRHAERMMELQIKQGELAVQQGELKIKAAQAGIAQQVADTQAREAAAGVQIDAGVAQSEAELKQRELDFQYEELAHDDKHRAREADMAHEEAMKPEPKQTGLTPKGE